MSSVRKVLESFVGQKLVFVSQHDNDDPDAFIMLHFEDGGGIKITLADARIDEVPYDELN